ncbi:hypothetical protein ACHAW6_001055, partial [Cyclotella cf. meneghiniana]
PSRCDGCDQGFTVEHALNCKKGKLVGIRHNNARDKWAHLCSLAFFNMRVEIKPLIHYGHDSSERSPCCATTPPPPTSLNNITGDEAQGDILMHGFWQRARGTIFDIRICDTEARSYANTSSDKVLECTSKEKVQKNEPACLAQCQDFISLIYSVDRLSSKEAQKAE